MVNAPQPNIGHMSVVYRSTVGDGSVNCRWHIGQLSVAYQSCVSMNDILRAKPNVFQVTGSPVVIGRLCLVSVKYRSSSGGVSAKCRSGIGQVSAKCRPSIGEVSARYW